MNEYPYVCEPMKCECKGVIYYWCCVKTSWNTGEYTELQYGTPEAARAAAERLLEEIKRRK